MWEEECNVAVEDRKRANNLHWNYPTPSNLIHYNRCITLAKHTGVKNKNKA
jgi:hypothetical protein